MAYVRGSSSVFRKSKGTLPVSTRIILGPYLCGVFIRQLIYRRRVRQWVERAPGVYCGGLLGRREALSIRSMGITGVLDLTAEHGETRALRQSVQANWPIEYLNVPVLDLTKPSDEQLDVAIGFIAKHAIRGGVYVHCALGVSRSVGAVAAYVESQPAPASGQTGIVQAASRELLAYVEI
jgi:hypothetical protein